MTSTSDTRPESQTRTYDRSHSVVFLKTKERFGGLSNMAAGFPLCVNGIRIRTSEALYQTCRFPHLPEVQAEIIGQRSPMTAKMKSKPHRRNSRPDWDRVRIAVMRWCIRVKLAQNWDAFSKLLLETGDHPIVEQSRKDAFWGAKEVDERTLVGTNALGRLLMELREIVRAESRESLLRVQPLDIQDFQLMSRPIGVVTAPAIEPPIVAMPTVDESGREQAFEVGGAQGLLFGGTGMSRPPVDGDRSSGILALKPYPETKPSSVEWLGEIPRSWEVRRNGRLFAQRNETGFAELPILEVSLRTGVRVRSFENSDRKQVMSDRNKYKRALAGDIAYNMMRMWQGAVGVAPTDGLVSPAYVVARPLPGTEAKYFERLFRTPVYMQEVDNYSRGIVKDRNRLYWEDFKAMPSCYPPPNEQTAIVRYLDHVGGQLRRLARAKRRLIELLTEQKQAIVHRAVTRGLEPGTRLRESGVATLGAVPNHWEVRKLRQCGSIVGGMTPSMEVRRYWGGDVPWVTPKDMKAIAISDSSVRVTQEALAETSLRKVRAPAVLLVVRGMILARKVPVAWTENSITINQDMKAICPSEGVDARYLATMLDASQNAFAPLIDEAGHGTKRLPTERWREIVVGLPPISEQKAILEHLDHVTTDVDAAISRARREIELFDEFRVRLCVEVVTGRLDVREAASAIPGIEPPSVEESLADALDEEEADLGSNAEEARV